MRIIRRYRLISIHALHEESDDSMLVHTPLGQHISIHALHEESDYTPYTHVAIVAISIHALHEESDAVCRGLRKLSANFNPRSP